MIEKSCLKQELDGKRLLIIGCTNYAQVVAEFAHQWNVKIIAAGLRVSKAIEAIADEVYKIEILDRKALSRLIVEKEIDGIFGGGSEDVISCLIDVAEATGRHFYATRELWDGLMNKQRFKDVCREHGVLTPIDYVVREDYLEEDSKNLPYPVVIKPVDSCGANGVVKCERQEDFVDKYLFSKSKSGSGVVTVESFIDGEQVGVYYTFADGKASFSSMHDKYLRKVPGTFIPLAEIYAYPSRHLQLYEETTDEKVRKMLLDIGIKNGITSVQGFYDHGVFRFIEIGYRLGGTSQFRYTRELNNFSSFHMMMIHSLTGKMDGYDQNNETPHFRKPCCTLSFLSKGGKIARIEGVDAIRDIDEIIHFEERYKVGDTIPVTRTVAQFHYRFYIIANTVERMKDVINYIQDTVKAYDENGESMLITHFDTNKLDFGNNKFEG